MTEIRRRRNNAPVRPRRRPATSIPDLLIAFAVALLTMSAVFVVATFTSDSLSSGDVGTDLARVFAGTLALTAFVLILMALVLLRDERTRRDHYLFPAAVGIVMGGLEAAVFLNPSSPLFLLIPGLLLFFVLRPVRRAFSSMFAGQGRR